MTARGLARLRARLRDEAGLGAVEFALLFPSVLMIFLLLGHMSEILMAEARVERAARNLAAAAALMESISDTQMADLMAGAAAVVAPTAGELSVTLTSVRPQDGAFTVLWSDGTAPRAAGETLALGTTAEAAYGGLEDANILVGEVRLAYVSRLAHLWNALPFATQALALTTTLSAQAEALPATVEGSPPAIVATTRVTAGGAAQ